MQPGLTFSTIIRKKIDFPTTNHKRYINVLPAQFTMIGNTYLELKLFKNPFEKFSAATMKSLDFQKLSNKEIYFTLQQT